MVAAANQHQGAEAGVHSGGEETQHSRGEVTTAVEAHHTHPHWLSTVSCGGRGELERCPHFRE